MKVGLTGSDQENAKLAAKFIAIASGFEVITPSVYPNPLKKLLRRCTKPETKCLLPECKVMTSHNGGYCCPEHCKEHRRYTSHLQK